MPLYQITIAEQRRFALARDEAERRSLVRALVSVAAGRLLFFNLVDDHFHAAARTDQPRLLATSLRRVIAARRRDLKLKPAWTEPIASRGHLMSLVRYQVLQADHHRLVSASLLDAGCCFQDLVKARVLDGFSVQPLKEEAPRLHLSELFAQVGLEAVELAPATDESLRRAGLARIVELAGGVFCAGPDLSQDRTAPVVAARTLVAQLARRLGFPTAEAARYLGIAMRTVRGLAVAPVDERAAYALRLRLPLADRDVRRVRSA